MEFSTSLYSVCCVSAGLRLFAFRYGVFVRLRSLSGGLLLASEFDPTTPTEYLVLHMDLEWEVGLKGRV